MDKLSGYEKINQNLMAELKSINWVERAPGLGLRITASSKVEVNFLGTFYLIGNDGIYTCEGEAVEINLGSVLAGYLIKNGRETLTNQFVPLSELTGMPRPGKNNYVKNSLESRLADHVQKNKIRFGDMMMAFGAKSYDAIGSGGKCWTIYLLPKIPIQTIFYEGDEDFPPELSFLLDSTATHYLEFEFLAVFITIFVEKMIDTLNFKLQ